MDKGHFELIEDAKKEPCKTKGYAQNTTMQKPKQGPKEKTNKLFCHCKIMSKMVGPMPTIRLPIQALSCQCLFLFHTFSLCHLSIVHACFGASSLSSLLRIFHFFVPLSLLLLVGCQLQNIIYCKGRKFLPLKPSCTDMSSIRSSSFP